MKILIVSPPTRVNNGNRTTAEEWAAELIHLGHEVRIRNRLDHAPADLLVAIHAHRSHDAVREFRQAQPAAKLVVALAGTDLYPALSENSLQSLELADRIVVLQEKALGRVPERHRAKTRIIRLSAPPTPEPRERATPRNGEFQVSVVGHLRAVKDPMRTAAASRRVPAGSKISVQHAGAILEAKFAALVEQERRENPRYRWLGELSGEEAYRLIAESDLFVLSSMTEGGSRVLSEAVVAGRPVLAARNDASTSLLGDDYPGLFEPGDTGALASLLERSETDQDFLAELTHLVRRNAERCSEARELEGWQRLLQELLPVAAD